MRAELFYDCTSSFVHSCASTASRYTGKERDTESGLDYFGARYYASSMGRFSSPNWSDKPEAVPYSDLMNPQSLNLYGYVNNNPLSKVDKDGHCLEDACVLEGATAVVAFGALTVSAYLQTPSGQRSLADAASSAAATISSTFHSIFSKSDNPAPSTPAGAEGSRTAQDDLPRNKDGVPVPDAEAAGKPHTQLGEKTSDRTGERYPQSREFDKNGNKVKDIDHTDHGRLDVHTNPHEHPYRPSDGKRMPAQPVDPKPPTQ